MTYTMQKLLPTIIMKYDLVNNILGITNTADPQNIAEKNKAKLGGAYSHSYVYDDINRLISADGKAKTASYRLDMTYGIMGEPLTKKQKVDSSKVAQSYAFAYLYEDSDHPTAPSQIGHNHYTYDANGNPTLVENDSLNTERRMYWDEDNRLMVLSDNGKTSRYTYNAAGERVVKSHGDLEGVYVNGAPQGMTFHETEDYTIYPAPIITVTKNRFTKHYFVGDKRIASKLGTGKFSNVYGISSNNVTAGQKDYAARMLQIEKQREEYYRKLGTPPGVPTMKGATADPDNTGYGYNTIIGELGDHSVPEGWVQQPKFNDKGDVPGPPIQWQKPEDPDNAQPGYGYVPADTAHHEDIFYYHSDHLGSTSYVTDAKANITQFDAYLPYGELLVDEHSSSEEMPYKFNGKEFDQETGLYYYGARYMNPVTSLWYGVDPLAEKYPNIGGYAYCAGNPIKLIDTDGRKIKGVTRHDAQTFREDIHGVLSDEKFGKVRELIKVKGKTFTNIDATALETALEGVSLTIDEKTYIDLVVNTINSDKIHTIEYMTGEFTSEEGATAFRDHMNSLGPGIGDGLTPNGVLRVSLVEGLGKEGFNVPTADGSHSFVSSKATGNLRPVTSGHELFGHGIPSANGLSSSDNNNNAIRTDNLIRRLLKMPQRDGSDHSGYKEGQIKDPQNLPLTK